MRREEVCNISYIVEHASSSVFQSRQIIVVSINDEFLEHDRVGYQTNLSVSTKLEDVLENLGITIEKNGLAVFRPCLPVLADEGLKEIQPAMFIVDCSNRQFEASTADVKYDKFTC